MKAKFLRVFAGMIACTAAFCLSALATETVTADENGAYTVKYSGTAGNYYSIVVVSGEHDVVPTISDEYVNIIYINQVTADNNGIASFENFKTKENVDGTVFIGRSNLDDPVLYGYLEAAPVYKNITVPAGSTVYFQDGKYTSYATETEVSVNLGVDGYVVVNTGYTAQTIYKVADGTLTELYTNALLTQDEVSIRVKDPTGIRFKSSVSNQSKTFNNTPDDIVEYGFIVTVESKKTALPEDYNLDLYLVAEGKAVSGWAYKSGEAKDYTFSFDDNYTIFTGVAYNIPQTKTGYTTKIAARPYYKTQNGDVVYGEVKKSTLYDIAKAIKEAGGEDYTSNKEYIDSIVDKVEKIEPSEVFIDLSELYKDN